MSLIEISIIGWIFLFILMFMGMPIGLSMALVGFVGFALIGGFDAAINMVGLVPYSTVASYIFSVLPLFLLMGEFASVSGLMGDAYQTAYKWLGQLPGGLAMATIGGCAGFAAVCGSSVATAATMTRIALPDMLKYKYDPSLATGTLAAGGTLGILIPPSLGFIVYGMIAEQSIGKLYMAGILPGIMLALMFMATIYIQAKSNPMMGPAGPRVSWRQKLVASKNLIGVLVLFLLVMGGIWGGIFTPTEAAAVAAIAAFCFVIGRRQLNRQNIISTFTSTARTTGMCLTILTGAMIFGYFIAVTGLPMTLSSLVSGLPIPSLGILICILIVYIILGCVMDSLAVVLLTTPIFLPVLVALGYNPIWWGVILTIMSELGLITPPVGANVFVIAGMAKGIPMYTIFKGITPFCITMLVCVAVLIAFPQIALFLPQTMMTMK